MMGYAESFDRFLADVSEVHRAAAPNLRYGQTFFNLLHAERPDLADELRGSEIDPFHFDRTTPGLLDWVERNWYERVDSLVKR
jgi:hypothetical protein